MARNIQSLERAAAMLRLLAGGERRLGLSDIASSLGLAKGTAHGILRTLQQEGFVEQDAGVRALPAGRGAAAAGQQLPGRARAAGARPGVDGRPGPVQRRERPPGRAAPAGRADRAPRLPARRQPAGAGGGGHAAAALHGARQGAVAPSTRWRTARPWRASARAVHRPDGHRRWTPFEDDARPDPGARLGRRRGGDLGGRGVGGRARSTTGGGCRWARSRVTGAVERVCEDGGCARRAGRRRSRDCAGAGRSTGAGSGRRPRF